MPRTKRLFNYKFKNKKLLIESLTHKSYANENQDKGFKDNERLEFLGDSVLGFVVTDLLIKRFPDTDEGTLSRFRSEIVNEKRLADFARTINLGTHIYLGKGEAVSNGSDKDSILSSTLEAVFAAIFCDGGFKKIYSIIKNMLQPIFDRLEEDDFSRDYKTKLQKLTQESMKIKPQYRTASEHGPDHKKVFEVEILLEGKVKARAVGLNKKEAEQNAARLLIEKLNKKD